MVNPQLKNFEGLISSQVSTVSDTLFFPIIAKYTSMQCLTTAILMERTMCWCLRYEGIPPLDRAVWYLEAGRLSFWGSLMIFMFMLFISGKFYSKLRFIKACRIHLVYWNFTGWRFKHRSIWCQHCIWCLFVLEGIEYKPINRIHWLVTCFLEFIFSHSYIRSNLWMYRTNLNNYIV